MIQDRRERVTSKNMHTELQQPKPGLCILYTRQANRSKKKRTCLDRNCMDVGKKKFPFRGCRCRSSFKRCGLVIALAIVYRFLPYKSMIERKKWIERDSLPTYSRCNLKC